MPDFLYILILIAIFIIGAYVCMKNYKNRAKSIGSNLLEYCLYINEHYYSLSEDNKMKLKNSLSEKELFILNDLVNKSPSLGKNLNVLQGQMFILEGIMGKIKALES